MGCSCGATTPSQGFDRAQAVFTGTILNSKKSKWVVSVERVWKGEVESQITLRDAHAGSSCASQFKKGVGYLFLVNVEKTAGLIAYTPQVCNWGTRLNATKVGFGDQGPYRWTEDWVLMDRGEGTVPTKKRN